jgi:hypothetical protein
VSVADVHGDADALLRALWMSQNYIAAQTNATQVPFQEFKDAVANEMEHPSDGGAHAAFSGCSEVLMVQVRPEHSPSSLLIHPPPSSSTLLSPHQSNASLLLSPPHHQPPYTSYSRRIQPASLTSDFRPATSLIAAPKCATPFLHCIFVTLCSLCLLL